jgi:chromosome partitioning protein
MSIISIANLKGGVGKTNITYNLGGSLAETGDKVLLVDMDQQGNLSSCFFDNIYAVSQSILNVFQENFSPDKIIHSTQISNLDIIPSNLHLAKIEIKLAVNPDAQYLILDQLNEHFRKYNWVLFDCPPDLGLPTRSALIASEFVIIPIECQEYALVGSKQLESLIQQLQKRANRSLNIRGCLISKFNSRTRLENSYLENIKNAFGSKLFQTIIPYSIRYAECIERRKPITELYPTTPQAETYRQLVKELRS